MEKEFTNSKDLLNYQLAKHFTDAAEAKAAGKLICWSTAVAPIELMTAMDDYIYTVFPENHCAGIGARKQSIPMLEISDAMGFPVDICSYTRINFGYAIAGESKGGNIPKPDLVMACSNTCFVVIKWFETISRMFNIPFIVIDTPYIHGDTIPPQATEYVKGQIESAKDKLAKIVGKPFNEAKFQQAMKYSEETIKLWVEGCNYTRITPSPMNGFDMFNYMAVVVFMRCSAIGPKLLKMWIQELSDRAKEGKGPWDDQEEKYRIFWDGITIWPYLSGVLSVLKKNGVNMVASNYPALWYLQYTAGDMDSVANAYLRVWPNRDLESNIKDCMVLAKDYNIDGIACHSNRSCKLMCMKQFPAQNEIFKETGLPSIIFDGDHTDPGVFSMAQFETRLQALCEMMEARKGAKK